MKKRCEWVGENELMVKYHDEEWGKSLHEDTRLFEALIIDGFQAGLSWQTILNKRENFRKTFDNFDARRIASYDAAKKKSLMQDAGIIRNQLKIDAAVDNAKSFLEIQKEFGSFDKYIWQFACPERLVLSSVEGSREVSKPKKNAWKRMDEIPAQTVESEAMSKDLKNRGFRFVGPTICYAFMQGVGMVNDHVISCFRHKEVSRKK